jgi:hypothetical protein
MPSASVFYDNYVVKSKPVIFKGTGKESDAFQLWTDIYLRWVISMAQKHLPPFFCHVFKRKKVIDIVKII